MIAIVAPAYRQAARFVPLTSVAYLAYGFLVVVARASEFPRRYIVYGTATLLGAAVMCVITLTLGRSIGGNGAALGDLVGALAGVCVIAGACLVSRSRLAIDGPRVAGVVAIGALCYVIGVVLADRHPALHPLLSVGAIALYPALLILTGIVPLSHRAMMGRVGRDLGATRRERTAMIARIDELPVVQQRVILALLRDRQSVGRVAEQLGMEPANVGAELVRGLARVSATPSAGKHDVEIGRWLLSTDAVTSKDGVQRKIESDGASPAEIHGVEAAFTALRSAPAKAWMVKRTAPGTLPQAPWPLDPEIVQLLDRTVRDAVPRRRLAADAGVTERELDRRIVGGLRSLAGLSPRPQLDRLLAGFLFDGPEAPPGAAAVVGRSGSDRVAYARADRHGASRPSAEAVARRRAGKPGVARRRAPGQRPARGRAERGRCRAGDRRRPARQCHRDEHGRLAQ